MWTPDGPVLVDMDEAERLEQEKREAMGSRELAVKPLRQPVQAVSDMPSEPGSYPMICRAFAGRIDEEHVGITFSVEQGPSSVTIP